MIISHNSECSSREKPCGSYREVHYCEPHGINYLTLLLKLLVTSLLVRLNCFAARALHVRCLAAGQLLFVYFCDNGCVFSSKLQFGLWDG